MYFKNHPLLLGILLCLTAFFSRAELVTIDKIAASVNDEIITWSDIDKAIRFYPYFKKKDQNEHTFYLNV
ncbi:MAG TPA: hypothetical protein VK469_12570, partial [Candidatus Kapabacteria bacterium]|nr:hypothetical protein [Candidatus Kapabacteria bacterium]